ncbi:N-acetylmuramoyl-L-alanine amidase [Synechococcus sp. CBW1107]|uniref:N-acetylmuramoyl-L-alanine amidase n=1 Tax=Synechococcus sp. CBW1107 TaxID=2789857 RepID=UPI0018CE2718|nr:N-acetylmuramoyl-L-alanine amidase [Synechococcus sp. CBW1107]QPN56364.1 N-acetylmuramoyl-L-alanine amidase [Synechococcus sp. CBW1107]
MPATIYLHWAATPYTWVRSGHYHTIISGDGRLNRLHAYSVDLPAHTYRRNSNSVALSCACMGGQPDPWTIPPTEAQLEAMCREAARIAASWGWSAGDISLQTVMTHAEAASNRDGHWMHDNYGPVIWGGSGERWDFLQLSRNGPPTGGDELRQRIRRHLSEPEAAASSRLEFRRASTMKARGRELAVEIDAGGTSWALAAEMLELYEIPYEWEASRRRILIGSLDVAPTFQDDQVQPSVGWPLFEMGLQRGDAPLILRGIVRENRAWCRVLEFAEEFGISVSFEPFLLWERRGG